MDILQHLGDSLFRIHDYNKQLKILANFSFKNQSHNSGDVYIANIKLIVNRHFETVFLMSYEW